MADETPDYDKIFAADPGALWTLPADDLLDRRARLRLSWTRLLDMLELPPGTQIKALQTVFDPPGVEIVVVHPGLPVIPREAESPVYGDATVTVHTCNPDDGHTYTRSTVEWPLPIAAI